MKEGTGANPFFALENKLLPFRACGGDFQVKNSIFSKFHEEVKIEAILSSLLMMGYGLGIQLTLKRRDVNVPLEWQGDHYL